MNSQESIVQQRSRLIPSHDEINNDNNNFAENKNNDKKIYVWCAEDEQNCFQNLIKKINSKMPSDRKLQQQELNCHVLFSLSSVPHPPRDSPLLQVIIKTNAANLEYDFESSKKIWRIDTPSIGELPNLLSKELQNYFFPQPIGYFCECEPSVEKGAVDFLDVIKKKMNYKYKLIKKLDSEADLHFSFSYVDHFNPNILKAKNNSKKFEFLVGFSSLYGKWKSGENSIVVPLPKVVDETIENAAEHIAKQIQTQFKHEKTEKKDNYMKILFCTSFFGCVILISIAKNFLL